MPSVSSSKAKDTDAPVVEDKTQAQADVDAAFKETVTRAITKIEKKEVPEKPTLDDQNKTFRTRLVAVWMLTNATLAIAIENINGLPNPNLAEEEQQQAKKQSTYFNFILWSTFGLSAVRFIGVSILSFLVSAAEWILTMSQCSVSSTSSAVIFSACSGGVEGFLNDLRFTLDTEATFWRGTIQKTLTCNRIPIG